MNVNMSMMFTMVGCNEVHKLLFTPAIFLIKCPYSISKPAWNMWLHTEEPEPEPENHQQVTDEALGDLDYEKIDESEGNQSGKNDQVADNQAKYESENGDK